jgi:hypothetical protein
MLERHHRVPGGNGDSPLDRLLRDLTALGAAAEPEQPRAQERLAAELGDDLLAAVHAELARLDFGGFPLCSRARRVA